MRYWHRWCVTFLLFQWAMRVQTTTGESDAGAESGQGDKARTASPLNFGASIRRKSKTKIPGDRASVPNKRSVEGTSISPGCHAAVCVSGPWRSFERSAVRRRFREGLINGLGGRNDAGAAAVPASSCNLDLFFYAQIAYADNQTASEVRVRELLKSEFPEAVNVSTAREDEPSPAPAPNYVEHYSSTFGNYYVDSSSIEAALKRAKSVLQSARDCFAMIQVAETTRSSEYKWVVHSHFDVGFYGQMEPLQSFFPGAIHVPYSRFPISEKFAIVPRGNATLYFDAVDHCADCKATSHSSSLPLQYQTEPRMLLYDYLYKRRREMPQVHLHDFAMSTVEPEPFGSTCRDLPTMAFPCETFMIPPEEDISFSTFKTAGQCTDFAELVAVADCGRTFGRLEDELHERGYHSIALRELEVQMAGNAGAFGELQVLSQEVLGKFFEVYAELQLPIKIMNVTLKRHTSPVLTISTKIQVNLVNLLRDAQQCILLRHLRVVKVPDYTALNTSKDGLEGHVQMMLEEGRGLIPETPPPFDARCVFDGPEDYGRKRLHLWETETWKNLTRPKSGAKVRVRDWHLDTQTAFLAPKEPPPTRWAPPGHAPDPKPYHQLITERFPNIEVKMPDQKDQSAPAYRMPASEMTEVLWDRRRDDGTPLPDLSGAGVTIHLPEHILRITRTVLHPVTGSETPPDWTCGARTVVTTIFDLAGQVMTFTVDGLYSEATLKRLEGQAKSDMTWYIKEDYGGEHLVPPPEEKRGKHRDRRYYTSQGHMRHLSSSGYPGPVAQLPNKELERLLLRRCLDPVLRAIGVDYIPETGDEADTTGAFKEFGDALYSLAYPLSSQTIDAESALKVERSPEDPEKIHYEVPLRYPVQVLHLIDDPHRGVEDDLKASAWPWRAALPHVDGGFSGFKLGFAGIAPLTDAFNKTGTGIYLSKNTGLSLFPSYDEYEASCDPPRSLRTHSLAKNFRPSAVSIGAVRNVAQGVNPFGGQFAIDNPWVACILTLSQKYGRFYFYDLHRLHNFHMESEDIARLSLDPRKGRLTFNIFFKLR